MPIYFLEILVQEKNDHSDLKNISDTGPSPWQTKKI